MPAAPMVSWLIMVLLAIALPLLAIWPIGLASNPYDEKRLLVVSLLAVIIALGIVAPSLRKLWLSRLAVLPPLLTRALLVILLLGMISAWRSELPVAAFTDISLWIVLFSAMTVVAVLRARLGISFDYTMIGVLGFILFVYLLLASGYVMQGIVGMRDLDFRMLFVNFSHLRFFNQFQSWTLPLAVLPLLYAEQRGWKLLKGLFAIAAANWWMLLFLSGGRGALLAVATASLFVALLFKGRIAQWLKWQGIVILGGLLIYLVLTQLLPALGINVVLNPELSRISLSGREDLWRLALSMITEHPLLGVGPMHYACTEPVLAGHPHNAPLQIAAEWGLPVALLLSALLLWLFYQALLNIRQYSTGAGTTDIAPVMLISLFAATLHAQLSGVIVMPISQMMMVVIGGWLWGVVVPANTGLAAWRWPYKVWLMLTAIAIAILMSVLSPVWHDTLQGNIALPDQTREYKPRFWIDGALCREDSFWRATGSRWK